MENGKEHVSGEKMNISFSSSVMSGPPSSSNLESNYPDSVRLANSSVGVSNPNLPLGTQYPKGLPERG